jgi:hypothetical protein
MKDSLMHAATSAETVVLANAGGLIGFLAAFFAPIYLSMFIVGLLIIGDTVTGLLKAKKLGLPITSRKLSAVLTKMLTYQLLVAISHGIEISIIDVPILKVVMGSIALVEFKSMLENISSYLGKDVVKYILKVFNRKEDELNNM